MQTSFIKRLLAYLIDLFIFSFLVLCVVSIFRIDENKILVNLTNQQNTINQAYLDGDMNFSNYVTEFSKVNYMIDKKEVLVNITNTVLLIILYVLVPFFLNGQTLGKKIVKIKIVKTNDKKLDLNTLMIRAILINFIGYMLITLLAVFIVKDFSYFIVTFILTIFELLLVIISTFMILYKSEKRGVHDYITKTKVIEVER